MKKKNEKTTVRENDKSSANIKHKGVGTVENKAGATDKVKPRSGKGLANEGTNVSYDEQR